MRIPLLSRRSLLSLFTLGLFGCSAAAPVESAGYVPARVVTDPPPQATPAPAPSVSSSAAAPSAPATPQPKPVPMPQPPKATKRAPAPPEKVVSEANKRAAQAPDASGTFNSIVQYSYEPGTLYQVFAAPMRITDLALQPGEHIVGQPACGDTVRWILAEGKSVEGGLEQWHVYLKPTRPALETNLAINTDRHAYMLELHSYEATYMAGVTWRFPQDEVAKLAEAAAQEKDAAPVVGLSSLNFHYVIKVMQGKPPWTPLQVFDDGKKTFVRFPEAMLVREAPALFVLRDKETQLVNYRMKNDFYVIDRLVDSAELRVGGKEGQEIVRFARTR